MRPQMAFREIEAQRLSHLPCQILPSTPINTAIQTTNYLNRHLLALQGREVRNAYKLRSSYARMLKGVDDDERLLRAAGSEWNGP